MLVLKRDGKEVMRGSGQEVYRYIHTHHCYSLDHALKFEGYSIDGEGGKDPLIYDLHDGDAQAIATAINLAKG